jgi:hypothetical protein
VEKIIEGIYVGSDEDVPEAKKRGYARLSATKDGPDGHRAMLGYDTLGAPKGKDYLFARKGDWMALNLIDVENPEFISEKAILAGIAFVKEMAAEGKKVLIHCNAGHSRGPTTTMLYLRSIGELPQPFNRAQKIFKTLYPKYDPGQGMEVVARQMWDKLEPKYSSA